MPDETVIDGEGSRSTRREALFQTLQNYGSSGAPLHFYISIVILGEKRDWWSRS